MKPKYFRVEEMNTPTEYISKEVVDLEWIRQYNRVWEATEIFVRRPLINKLTLDGRT